MKSDDFYIAEILDITRVQQILAVFMTVGETV